jgi:hypothetical protein
MLSFLCIALRHPGHSRRSRGTTVVRGVLEAAGSTSRTPLTMSATRTPETVSDKSEAVGHGAGMLAAPSAHEVYHRSLPGPSVQKLMGTSALAEPSRIEGSGVEATQHHVSDVEQQQMLHTNAMVGAREDEEAGRFRIPRLRTRHRNLLAATSEDLARGSVQEPMSQLCLDTIISTWLDFKHHCDQTDGHPLKLLFCKHCGEFFSWLDSWKRHQKKRPPTCYGVSPEEAQAKRTATMQAHDAMPEELKSLGTNGEAWTPFRQRIAKMFPKDPKSAKKGSQQQSQIKGPDV